VLIQKAFEINTAKKNLLPLPLAVAKMSVVLLVVVTIAVVLSVASVFMAFVFNMDLLSLFRKIFDVVLLPLKLFLRLFTGGSGNITSPSTPSEIPFVPQPATTHTTITKNEVTQCPPCDVKCPEIPGNIATANSALETEIRYLKNMLKFTGAIAKRENAINAQYREINPGFSVMCPAVQRLSTEYNFLKNQIREDDAEYSYFKNYFSKLTGIPSTSTAVHYDLIM